MSGTRKNWSFKRWRRRWNDRVAALSLRWRIWFDRHILSYEKRKAWRRRWSRRSERLGRAVEQAGYKVLPHRPEAAPDSWWTRLLNRLDDFVDRRVYPPALRAQHEREFGQWWRQFTSPFRHGNMRVRRWLGNYLQIGRASCRERV